MNPIYDRLALTYGSDRNREFYRSIAQALVRQCDFEIPTGEALDLACGTGLSLEVFLAQFRHLLWSAVDASPGMIEIAKQKLPHLDIRWTTARAEALPYESGQFNLITCNLGAHWFTDRAFYDVSRVLAPGGRLMASIPMLAPTGQSSGQEILRRILMKLRLGRDELDRSHSAGFASDETAINWPELEIAHRQDFILTEKFESPREFADTLMSRGSLHAIFGDHAGQAWEELLTVSDWIKVEINWSFRLLLLDKPRLF